MLVGLVYVYKAQRAYFQHPAPELVGHEGGGDHVAPLAMSRPRPMKCLVPCRCNHDLPVTCAGFDDSSSRTMPASDTHTRGSLPYQYTNRLPGQKKRQTPLSRDGLAA